jgi:RND family efflux transporter MFP subunit
MHLKAWIVASGLAVSLMLIGSTGVADPSSGRVYSVATSPAISQFRGVVAPVQQVVLNAPMDGTVSKVLVKEGEVVKKDQPLVQLDDVLQQVAVAGAELEAQSTSEQTKADLLLQEAQIKVDRIEEAFKKQAASEWEVRQTKLQRDQAAAALQTAKDQHEVALTKWDMEKKRLEKFKLTAPWDGRVIRTLVQEGATITQRDQVVSLVVLAKLEATVYVSADYFGTLEPGHEYRLVADKPVSAVLQGKLKTADPVIDPASQTFRCVFTIDNSDEKLPSGFTVTLELP